MNNNLYQDEKWISLTEEVFRLEDMRPGHLSNVLAFLRRHADGLKFQADLALCTGPQPRGDAASDAFEDACDQQFRMSAGRWIETTALVRRLRVLTGEESPNAHVPLSF